MMIKPAEGFRNRCRWMVLRVKKRLRFALMKRLLREPDSSLERAILIAGTARSGTTWLAEMIARQVPARLMFEPFHRDEIEALSGIPLFPYLRPDENHEDFEAFARSVLSGSIRHPWVDSQIDCSRPELRIVKEIRGNLFLRWLFERFPRLPIVLIVRHPCAVVSSRMRAGWSAEADLEDMMSQPKLVADHLRDTVDVIAQARSPVELHAVVWCIQNLVPLRQFSDGDLKLVFYEHLVQDTEEQLESILDFLGRASALRGLGKLRAASATTGPNSSVIRGEDLLSRWQRDLSAREAEEALSIVKRFGLDEMYGSSPLPTLSVASDLPELE